MISTLLLLAQILFYSVVPTLEYRADAEYKFRIANLKEAVGFCTFFESQTEFLEQEGRKVKWTPAHCGVLAPNQTAYYDNWDEIEPAHAEWRIWSEVYYDIDGKMATTKSNTITLVY